ncbi:MAG: DUF1294 domain-containing protein [Clostridia bacterium]|nr:DUF1294 domain-containing protein [Clostridia bacterium]
MSLKTLILAVYGGYLVLLSLITLCSYWADKVKAQNNSWRIPEKALLLMSIIGGAYGGFVAMLIFRHKTKSEHWYFRAINILGIILHTALIICVALVFPIPETILF